MSDHTPFLVLDQTCSQAVYWINEQFTMAGLQVIRTFDLKIARQANVDCPCPHHGTNLCDCQMVVLLVYRAGFRPISIIAHGYEGQTWFSVVDNPQQPADPRLESEIYHAMALRLDHEINLP